MWAKGAMRAMFGAVILFCFRAVAAEPGVDEANVYESAGQKGTKWTFVAGEKVANLKNSGISVGSLEIGGGVVIDVFSRTSYRGQKKVLQGPLLVADVSNGRGQPRAVPFRPASIRVKSKPSKNSLQSMTPNSIAMSTVAGTITDSSKSASSDFKPSLHSGKDSVISSSSNMSAHEGQEHSSFNVSRFEELAASTEEANNLLAAVGRYVQSLLEQGNETENRLGLKDTDLMNATGEQITNKTFQDSNGERSALSQSMEPSSSMIGSHAPNSNVISQKGILSYVNSFTNFINKLNTAGHEQGRGIIDALNLTARVLRKDPLEADDQDSFLKPTTNDGVSSGSHEAQQHPLLPLLRSDGLDSDMSMQQVLAHYIEQMSLFVKQLNSTGYQISRNVSNALNPQSKEDSDAQSTDSMRFSTLDQNGMADIDLMNGLTGQNGVEVLVEHDVAEDGLRDVELMNEIADAIRTGAVGADDVLQTIAKPKGRPCDVSKHAARRSPETRASLGSFSFDGTTAYITPPPDDMDPFFLPGGDITVLELNYATSGIDGDAWNQALRSGTFTLALLGMSLACGSSEEVVSTVPSGTFCCPEGMEISTQEAEIKVAGYPMRADADPGSSFESLVLTSDASSGNVTIYGKSHEGEAKWLAEYNSPGGMAFSRLYYLNVGGVGYDGRWYLGFAGTMESIEFFDNHVDEDMAFAMLNAYSAP